MIHPSIQPFIPQMKSLFKKHQIVNAYIFGSGVTGNFNKNSDIDFLVNVKNDLDPVICGEHLWDLEEELNQLLNRKIDLITERSLKNKYLISEINQTKELIYE